MRSGFVGIILLLLASLPAVGQWERPVKKVFVPTGADSIFLDSNMVWTPGMRALDSLGNPRPLPAYRYSSSTGWFFPLEPKGPPYTLEFSVLPGFRVGAVRNKDRSLLNVPQLPSAPVYSAPSSESQPWLGGISRNGSLSRSITVGSNQDAVLRSNLNLRLNGNLGERTTIQGSITDNNLPFQAGGVTQQLNEFDRIYLQVNNPDFGEIRAGDFDIGRDSAYFLDFRKRVTGAGYTGKFGSWTVLANAALAKGRFGRNTFMGTEGNQGPYPLSGASGERNIFIISGSERVYMDGVLLRRGEDADYIVDYNTAELTFTTLRPVTREKRIVVEFQYSDRNYLRSTLYGGLGYDNGNWSFRSLAYSEQDSRNQPLQQELSDEQKLALSLSGDRPALASSIVRLPWDENRVMYSLRDSLGFDSVLVHQPVFTDTAYSATFLFLGSNQGDYILEQSLGTGSVFRWVPPVNGVPQGQYAPVMRLTPPELLQVFTQSAAYRNEKGALQVEWSLSRRDLNLFSSLEDADNIGQAIRLRGNRKMERWTAGGSYEFVDARFTTVERLRNVEFARDWGLNAATGASDQHLGKASIGYSRRELTATLTSEALLQGSAFRGFRQNLQGNYTDSSWQVNTWASLLAYTDSAGHGRFTREKAQARYYWTPKTWTGWRSQGEWNRRFRTANPLLNSGYQFLENQVFQGFGDTLTTFVEGLGLLRHDDTVRQGELVPAARAWSALLRAGWRVSPAGSLTGQINYRELTRLDTVVPQERSITSRAQYRQRLWKGLVTSTTFYQAGIGVEPVRILSYLPVSAGTGTHTWEDYNDNGVQELDEFRPATYAGEGNFIQVFTPGTRRIRTSQTQFSQYLLLQPEAVLKKENNFQKALGRLSAQFNYQNDLKTLINGSINTLDPFRAVAQDTLLVSALESFRASLFLNRSLTKWGGEYTFQRSGSRNFLNQGPEARTQFSHSMNGRWWFLEQWGVKVILQTEEVNQSSVSFASRNYRITGSSIQPQLLFQHSSVWNATLGYTYSDQGEREENQAGLVQERVDLELRYALAGSWNVTGNLAYIRNAFNGNAQSPAGFELLQGLQNGANGTWQLGIQRQFGQGIVFSLEYQGRKSPDLPAIHTGSAQIKAFL